MTSVEIKNHEIRVQIPISIRFDEYTNLKAPKRTLVLLHGYGETKDRMFRKLGQHLTANAHRIIVLNAPFPAPQLRKEGYKEGYAWYFRSQSLTMIAPETCDSIFDELIGRCQLNSEPVTLIGFSQGGFVLPYLARKIKNLEQLIGISCGAHPHEFFSKSKPIFNIIHSIEDKVVDIATAEKQFSALGLDPQTSKFHRISGGHEIDSVKVEAIKSLLMAP